MYFGALGLAAVTLGIVEGNDTIKMSTSIPRALKMSAALARNPMERQFLQRRIGACETALPAEDT